MSYIIAIANAKGGVAKTTTTLSLGAFLAESGMSVLLIDLDPHANLTISLGLHPSTLDRTVADVMLGGETMAHVAYATPQEGMQLVPTNHDLQRAESHLHVRQDYELILRQALKSVVVDTVILDCPPTLGTLTHNALAAADLLLIPTQPEYFSAHALRDMLNMILSIRERSNPRLRYRILLTMLDRRNRIHRSLSQQIRTAFSQATFDIEIETDTRLRESPVFGKPINQYAPNSRAATQYRELAEEIGKTIHEFRRGYSPQA